MAKTTKAAAKAEPKAEKKGKADKAEKPGKKGKADPEALEAKAGDAPAVDPDELEEAEDEAAASSSGGGGGDNAALAAASGGEMSASFKNFRHHPDMENFYRFIYENDLRHEALAIIDDIMKAKIAAKSGAKTGKSKSAH